MSSDPCTPGAPPLTKSRTVLCPTCRQATVYDTSNPHRPFCSERCRGMDFGAWASEDYRIGARPEASDDGDDESRG